LYFGAVGVYADNDDHAFACRGGIVRVVTVRTPTGHQAARVDGEDLVLLDASDVGALLSTGPDWRDAAGDEGERIGAEGADLAPIVPGPEKIICVGLNYRSHAEETGLGIPEFPTIFAKYTRALVGPGDPIVLARNSDKVDWEAELVVVVGREVRHADEAEARRAIAGYTVANDISMRDWQSRTRQWLQGKTFESTTPVGPALVTLDELDNPDALRLTCEVDGELVQEASTEDLIFSPAAVVAYLSEIMTLAPGDLILTGTPSGIGARREPPQFLKPGQVVRTVIEGVGELVNRCVAEDGE
jgi:acylpyruvate hydrolase